MLTEISEYTVFSQYSNKHFKVSINSVDCETVEKRFAIGCTENGYCFVYDSFHSICKICCRTKHSTVLTDAKWEKNSMLKFCSTSLDGNLRLYDVTEHDNPFQTFNTGSHLHSCSFNFKSPIIACGMDGGSARLFDLRQSVNLQALETSYESDVEVVEWSPDSEYLVVCGDTDGHLMLFDTRQIREPYEFRWWRLQIDDESDSTAHDSSIVGLTFSPNGRRILTLDNEKYLRQWGTDTGLATAFEYKMNKVNKKNRRIGICMTDKNEILIPENNSIINITKKEKMVGHIQNVTAVTANADGFVSTDQNGFLCVWRKRDEIQIENDTSDWSD